MKKMSGIEKDWRFLFYNKGKRNGQKRQRCKVSTSQLYVPIGILFLLMHQIWETTSNKYSVLTFHCLNKLFLWSQTFLQILGPLVTQPMMQCRLNPMELRSMDSYIQILCRFQKSKKKVPPPSPLSNEKSPFPPKDEKKFPLGG